MTSWKCISKYGLKFIFGLRLCDNLLDISSSLFNRFSTKIYSICKTTRYEMCFLLVLHHCLQSRPPIRSIVRGDEIWYHLTKSLNVSSNNPCPQICNNAYPEVIARLSEHWKTHHQIDISILGQQTCAFSLPILSIFLEKTMRV